MDKKIGEVFQYNGVTLITIENKNNNGCKGCYFFNGNFCTDSDLSCSALCRDDNKSVIFRKVEDMGSRTVKLTLEKAREFYKKGEELRDLALLAFTEEELTKVELPETWEEFCSQFNMRRGDYYIDIDSLVKEVSDDNYRNPLYDRNMLPSKKAAEQHLALMQLHQLRDCYRQGWEPNWSDGEDKYCIVRSYNDANHLVAAYKGAKVFLSFQSADIARLFLKNFRGLIEAAGDLV